MSASHEYDGLYAEVRDNLNKLYHQALNFKLPAYQKKKENLLFRLDLTVIKQAEKMYGSKVSFWMKNLKNLMVEIFSWYLRE